MILQKYDLQTENAFILYNVIGLMSWVHEQIHQVGEIYYIDVSVSFELLNISIILLYTSYIVDALLLDLFIILDELEITIKKVINLLKTIFSEFVFFSYRWMLDYKYFFNRKTKCIKTLLAIIKSAFMHILYTLNILKVAL